MQSVINYPNRGNFGDSKYRGNKYSFYASKLLLILAKKHNLNYVLISCEPHNIASNRICRLLNADFIETVDIPNDNEMYLDGIKKINIYKINL